MTGFVRLFAFFSSTVKRLTRSTREVTCLARRLLDQHKTALPMAEFSSVRVILGAVQGADITVEFWRAALAVFRQVPPELLRHALLRGDVAADRLLAEPELRTFLDRPVTDLPGRPAVPDPLDDPISKQRIPDQLRLAGALIDGFLMRGAAVVAVMARQTRIAEPVARDLAINGGV
ncbi:hypothetical protein C357_21017 [Citreicella sp. 357]|nr:hypothetical protein C357_21017 [Citreicella sp. 357]